MHVQANHEILWPRKKSLTLEIHTLQSCVSRMAPELRTMQPLIPSEEQEKHNTNSCDHSRARSQVMRKRNA